MAKGVTGNDTSKMFSEDVVAAVLMASGTTSLSMKQYEMMSALDGTRTASGFQHAFRSVIAKSKDLKARVDAGEQFLPVQPTPKRAGTNAKTASVTPSRKRKKADVEDEGTPSRKKASPKKKAVNVPAEDTGDDFNIGDDLPLDMDEFIKKEQEWEKAFA